MRRHRTSRGTLDFRDPLAQRLYFLRQPGGVVFRREVMMRQRDLLAAERAQLGRRDISHGTGAHAVTGSKFTR